MLETQRKNSPSLALRNAKRAMQQKMRIYLQFRFGIINKGRLHPRTLAPFTFAAETDNVPR